MRSQGAGCLYNPVVVKETQHRWEKEAAERACHRAAEDVARTRRWAAEDDARTRRWAAEDKAKAQS